MKQQATFHISIRPVIVLLLALPVLQTLTGPSRNISAEHGPEALMAIPENVVLVKGDGATGRVCGDTWTAACSLSYALDAVAQPGDQIWVADGVYTPDSNGLNDPRRATFQLSSGVAIYGGFDEDDDEFSDRDWITNIVTLSGDLNNNDDGTPAGMSKTVIV